MATFESPEQDLDRRDKFGKDEIGLTHPFGPGFLRFRDDGSIELMAGEGVGIIMNPKKNSITIIADTVKLITSNNGLKWNRTSFNERAVNFNEPTLLVNDNERGFGSLYRDVEYFTDNFASLFRSTSLSPALSRAADQVVLDTEAAGGPAPEESEDPDDI